MVMRSLPENYDAGNLFPATPNSRTRKFIHFLMCVQVFGQQLNSDL